ncbi:MAG TPA: acyclic terpene utilization AtuA family protein [Candidatus Angelobacter sp.]|nr:acyclic terpene utilization AtuA family protein [Candidatus Angelobacter sp.]
MKQGRVRIANGSAFWGDSAEAPLELLRGGPLDYLTLDYLAEITMSILQKVRERDPRGGYAHDFVGVIKRGAKEIVERGVKVIANAGGLNPVGCREAVAAVLRAAGYGGRVKIGVVTGDDIMPRLEELLDGRILLFDEADSLFGKRTQVKSANVYYGAFPIAEALQQGADIVITGRCNDAALALGPMIHEFGWKNNEWDRISAGTIAGHIIECGAQCTGGNCQADWESIPDFAGIGYPIIEAEPGGTFVVTKHRGTGGRVSVAGVTEQLLYEIGDPRNYITPDGIADFTTIQLEQEDTDRVRCWGIQGRPSTEFYKVSISYSAGFKAVGTLVYSWPDAYKKARAADQILRERLCRLGLKLDAVHSEFVGVNACHGEMSGEPANDIAEVVLRIGARSAEKAPVERFLKELVPIALNGPPSVTGLNAGRSKVDEIIAYAPALIPKKCVAPQVEVVSA